MSTALPIVSIVGRANVGKSWLFNRIVKKRIAIIDPQSGVTRDIIMHEVEWENRRFRLSDTAGLTFSAGEELTLEKTVRNQTLRALETSDFLIFTVDAVAGLTPLDRLVFEQLVAGGKPFCIAVNKADNEILRQEAGGFAELGRGEIFPVSALHASGLYSLLDHVIKHLPETTAIVTPEPFKIAIVGKPNVGKSSFLNRILNFERVMVDAKPGTTRDAVDAEYIYKTRHLTLIDTAGMRKGNTSNDSVERYSLMRTEDSIKRADTVLLLIDGAEGVTQQDRRLIRFVTEHYRGCVIAANKWDKVEGINMSGFTGKIKDLLGSYQYIPIVAISAKTGLNVKKCLDMLMEVEEQYEQRIPTPKLNKIIKHLTERMPPPYVSGKRLKIYYVTQTGIKPPTFDFFINSRKSLKETYMRHLLNELREEFGLKGVTVKFVFHEKAKKTDRYKDDEQKAAQKKAFASQKPRRREEDDDGND